MFQQSRPQYSPALNELALLADGEPTIRIKALVLPKVPLPRDTEPLLPLDNSGRSYLSYSGEWGKQGLLWDDTLYHVESLVERYRELSDEYPAEICLCAQRYFVRPQIKGKSERVKNFYPRVHAKSIPFVWEYQNVGNYEILVRGKAS